MCLSDSACARSSSPFTVADVKPSSMNSFLSSVSDVTDETSTASRLPHDEEFQKIRAATEKFKQMQKMAWDNKMYMLTKVLTDVDLH